MIILKEKEAMAINGSEHSLGPDTSVPAVVQQHTISLPLMEDKSEDSEPLINESGSQTPIMMKKSNTPAQPFAELKTTYNTPQDNRIEKHPRLSSKVVVELGNPRKEEQRDWLFNISNDTISEMEIDGENESSEENESNDVPTHMYSAFKHVNPKTQKMRTHYKCEVSGCGKTFT